MSQTVESKNTYDLFMGYLDVVNEALDKHRDTPVIGELTKVITDLGESKKISAAIYKSDADEPFDYFTVRIADGGVQLDSRGKSDPDIDWRVSQSYLAKVNENPEQYVENPLKLDMDWLKSRVGL